MRLIWIFIFMTISFNVFSMERGLEVQVSKLAKTEKPGKQYAVFIAVNKYQQWNPLKEPVKDAEEIKKTLLFRYYIDQVYSLYDENATKKNILGLFQKLQKELRANDSLLIFYAGHGHLDQNSKTGFWIPVDAGTDELEQDRWIPNIVIRGLLSNIRAKHIFLISDSCFSGDILNMSRGNVNEINNDYFKKAYQRRSRQVLTSGASETVPDQSDFARQLKLALEENNKPYLDPLMLFNEVRLGVSDSTPMLGDLKDTGHQNGASFILFLKSDAPVKPVAQVAQKQEIKPEEKKVPQEDYKENKNVVSDDQKNNSKDSEEKTYIWGFLGVGGGAASGANGPDFSGMGGVVGLSYQSGYGLFSCRISTVSASGGTESSYTATEENSIGDLAAMVGFSFKSRYAMFSMATGLSIVVGTKVVETTSYGYTNKDSVDYTGVGVPFEMQLFLTPSTSFGFGLYFFGNANAEKSFYGFLFGIQFGRLW